VLGWHNTERIAHPGREIKRLQEQQKDLTTQKKVLRAERDKLVVEATQMRNLTNSIR
jgi:hypothetical protein